jgi:hypothetical protein
VLADEDLVNACFAEIVSVTLKTVENWKSHQIDQRISIFDLKLKTFIMAGCVMIEVFLDTAYVIALAAPTDDFHQQALALADYLGINPRSDHDSS